MRRALIVGGGPAGMSAAMALQRAGVDCEIVELSADGRPVGVGIGLQSPPLRALKSLDLFEPIVQVARPHELLVLHTAGDQFVHDATWPNVNEPDDPSFVMLSRVALHEVMAGELAKRGIPMRLETTVDALEELGDGVQATLSDGTTAVYDLVVGADGVHSKVRQLVLQDAPKPEWSGQSIWRAGARCPDGLDRYTVMVADGHRIGLVPLPDDQLYLWMLDSTLGPKRPPSDELVGLFQERMSVYGGFAPAVAEQITEPEQLDFRALLWLLAPAPWHAGRVVLIGDAVHATLPHLAFGAGIAIEDAVVLGQLVADGVPADALGARLVARRFERARLIVETTLQLSKWEQQGGPPHPDAARIMAEAWAKMTEPI